MKTPFPGIEKTPGVCGGSACIGKTRMPVWLLVEGQRLGTSDDDFLLAYPHIQKQDLENAWRYAQSNPEEIDRLIFENSDEEMKRQDAEDEENDRRRATL